MAFEKMTSLLKGPIYEYNTETRRRKLIEALREVATHHYANCAPYRKFCKKRQFDPEALESLEELPYLPTSIFKDVMLLSVPMDRIFREMQSSATTSGRPSRIGLDKENNRRWTISMQRMLLDRIGNERFRFLILDDESVLQRSRVISARASMTRSLLFCANKVETCLGDHQGSLTLDMEKLDTFLAAAKNNGEGTIIFGFTFILYKYVVLPLLDVGKQFDLSKAKIIHAGGWKKLEDQKVTQDKLLELSEKCFGISPENIIDLYGFTEQGGMLYPTCEHDNRHTPAWSDVICRDLDTLEPLPPGVEGLMQFITPIQTSYPGHSILTEDVGIILGYDNCPCGRRGTVFKVIGRSRNATEVRGCGDIMAEKFA